MHFIDQLIDRRREAHLSAERAIKTLIEDNDDLDGGQRYHYITQYGSKKVEVVRLEAALHFLHAQIPPLPTL